MDLQIWEIVLELLYVFNMRNKVIYIQDGIREVNEETITIFGSAITLTVEIQIYLMCFLCIYQVMLGRADEASYVASTQKPSIQDFAMSHKCKPNVLMSS